MMPPIHIIEFAVEASVLSPCQSKRGAAVFRGEDLVSVGYNHKPKGFLCDHSAECKRKCPLDAVHAEQSAMVGVPMSALRGSEMLHVKTIDGLIVPSMMPSCLQCSKLIIEAGIEWMWLYHAEGWKRYTAAQFHWHSGAYMPPKHGPGATA